MKTFLKYAFIVIAILSVLGITVSLYRLRDRHAGYEIDISKYHPKKGPVEAGFSAIPIMPSFFETWTDVNEDSKYNPSDGDTFNDVNGNGKFDAIWLAGFHQNRPASGVNDSLWVRTMYLSDGTSSIALCSVDMMGISHDDVVTVRKRVAEHLAIDYIIVTSTHVHSSPDLMGMWGPSIFESGVNEEYREQVLNTIVQSVIESVKMKRLARLNFVEDLESAIHLVGDSRPPYVLDAGLRIMHVTDRETAATLGTIVNWGNHPETAWAQNVKITSDFPHYLRKYTEEGVFVQDSLIAKGLGGTTMFVNGAIGGLMTTRPRDTIPDPISQLPLTGNSFEKVEAQGKALALSVIKAVNSVAVSSDDSTSIGIRAKTVHVKNDNFMFKLAGILGIFQRGYPKWGYLRTEVATWSIGSAMFVHVPGEIYPELINGGVEVPEGSDFSGTEELQQGIRGLSNHPFTFVIGLSNDEIGYIIPKSQWDVKAPYTYGRESAPYGEVNSLGPDTAPLIVSSLKDLIADLYKLIDQ